MIRRDFIKLIAVSPLAGLIRDVPDYCPKTYGSRRSQIITAIGRKILEIHDKFNLKPEGIGFYEKAWRILYGNDTIRSNFRGFPSELVVPLENPDDAICCVCLKNEDITRIVRNYIKNKDVKAQSVWIDFTQLVRMPESKKWEGVNTWKLMPFDSIRDYVNEYGMDALSRIT